MLMCTYICTQRHAHIPLLTGAHIVRLQNPPVPDWPLKAYTLIMVLAPHPKAKGEKRGIPEGCLDSTYLYSEEGISREEAGHRASKGRDMIGGTKKREWGEDLSGEIVLWEWVGTQLRKKLS